MSVRGVNKVDITQSFLVSVYFLKICISSDNWWSSHSNNSFTSNGLFSSLDNIRLSLIYKRILLSVIQYVKNPFIIGIPSKIDFWTKLQLWNQKLILYFKLPNKFNIQLKRKQQILKLPWSKIITDLGNIIQYLI